MKELPMRPAEALRRARRWLVADFEAVSPLTITQTVILQTLLNGPKNQTQLTMASGVDRSTMTESVRRMREKGLLARTGSVIDHRTNVVSITTAGREAFAKANARLLTAERRMLEFVPRGAKVVFMSGLRAIAMGRK